MGPGWSGQCSPAHPSGESLNRTVAFQRSPLISSDIRGAFYGKDHRAVYANRGGFLALKKIIPDISSGNKPFQEITADTLPSSRSPIRFRAARGPCGISSGESSPGAVDQDRAGTGAAAGPPFGHRHRSLRQGSRRFCIRSGRGNNRRGSIVPQYGSTR